MLLPEMLWFVGNVDTNRHNIGMNVKLQIHVPAALSQLNSTSMFVKW